MTKILAWESGELKEFEKLEVHRKGLRHPAISVFIFSRMAQNVSQSIRLKKTNEF